MLYYLNLWHYLEIYKNIIYFLVKKMRNFFGMI